MGSCLLFNIGVLQMEQNLLDEATKSFREALSSYNTNDSDNKLNDDHVVTTLKKLSSMKQSKGDIKGAIEANRDVLSILSASTDFKQQRIRNRKVANVMRDIADLNQAQSNLQEALENAIYSADLFRLARLTEENDDMDIDIDDETDENTP